MPRLSTASSAAAKAYGLYGLSLPSQYIINRALRVTKYQTQFLYRDPGGGVPVGNNQTFTHSFWYKRGAIGSAGAGYLGLAGTEAATGNTHGLFMETDNRLKLFVSYNGTFWENCLVTSDLFADCNGWYHFVWTSDTLNTNIYDRLRLYINGERYTNWLATGDSRYPSQGQTTPFNNNKSYYVFSADYGVNNLGEGLFSELQWIDGLSLDCNSFGMYDANKNWVPKPYTGDYGKRGFYLPFADNSNTDSLGIDYSVADKRTLAFPASADPYFGAISLMVQASGTGPHTNNRPIDRSPNRIWFNNYGNVTMGSFTPFTPAGTAPYNPTLHGGSAYFNGSTQFLAASANNALDFGSRDFTVEYWVNYYGAATISTGGAPVLNKSFGNANPTGSYYFGIGTNGATVYLSNGTGSWDQNLNVSATITSGKWAHVAIVRSGDVIRIYVDGISRGTLNLPTGYIIAASDRPIEIGSQVFGGQFNGSLCDLRVTVGTAVYTSNFTPPTAPLTLLPNTQLLLNFNTSNIIDESANFQLQCTRNAEPSNITKFEPSSILINSADVDTVNVMTPGNRFYFPDNFTIEAWMNAISGGDSSIFVLSNNAQNQYLALNFDKTASVFNIYLNSGTPTQTINVSPALSGWQHVALVRRGSTVTTYLSGTAIGSTTNSSALGYTPTANMLCRVGGGVAGSKRYYEGVRVTSGVARYTSNFTPPSGVFPAYGSRSYWTSKNFYVNTNPYTGHLAYVQSSVTDTPSDYNYTRSPVTTTYTAVTSLGSYISERNWSNSGNFPVVDITGLAGNINNRTAVHKLLKTKVGLTTGKWYWEVTCGNQDASTVNIYGMTSISARDLDGNHVGDGVSPGFGAGYTTTAGNLYTSSPWFSGAGSSPAIPNGTVLGFAYDADSGACWVRNSSGWYRGDPNTNTDSTFQRTSGTPPMCPAFSLYNSNTQSTYNFGQTPYAYTRPTGFNDIYDTYFVSDVRGNYCALNSNNKAPTRLVVYGDNRVDLTNVANGQFNSIMGTLGFKTGKWYWETEIINHNQHGQYSVGITTEENTLYADNANNPNAGRSLWNYNNGLAWYYNTNYSTSYNTGDIYVGPASTLIATVPHYKQGDTIGIAFDADIKEIRYFKNGIEIYRNTFFWTPSASWFPGYSLARTSANIGIRANFGQNPFRYRPPTNYNPICDTLIAATTAIPTLQYDRYFNTTSYTGGSNVYNPDPLAGYLKLALPFTNYTKLNDVSPLISNNASTIKWLANNSNTVSFTSPTPTLTSNYYSTATYFNGTNSRIIMTTSSSIGNYDFDMSSITDFTFEWWQYWVSLSNPSGYQTLWDTGWGNSNTMLIQTGNNNGRYQLYAWSYSSGTPILNESTAAVPGRWYHYALTRRYRTYTLYRDGRISAQNTMGASYYMGNGAVGSINISGQGATYHINGYLQDFRFYNGVCKYLTEFNPLTAVQSIINTESDFTTKQIAGFGFQPDLTWIQRRSPVPSSSTITSPGWQDSTRGPTSIISSQTVSSSSTPSFIDSFNNYGISLNSSASGNNPGDSYMAWNWRRSLPAGFDIVTYRSNGNNNVTVPHNLNATPAFIITKRISGLDFGSPNWNVYHQNLGRGYYLMLNVNNANIATAAAFSSVTSSDFVTNWNSGFDNFIAYVWAEIEGFSRFGYWVGNGQTDGPFIWTGFKPAFILYKNINNTNSWGIKDLTRTGINPGTHRLFGDSNLPEYNDHSTYMLSNGFKVNNTQGAMNTTNEKYIYAAFADSPLKYIRKVKL